MVTPSVDGIALVPFPVSDSQGSWALLSSWPLLVVEIASFARSRAIRTVISIKLVALDAGYCPTSRTMAGTIAETRTKTPPKVASCFKKKREPRRS